MTRFVHIPLMSNIPVLFPRSMNRSTFRRRGTMEPSFRTQSVPCLVGYGVTAYCLLRTTLPFIGWRAYSSPLNSVHRRTSRGANPRVPSSHFGGVHVSGHVATQGPEPVGISPDKSPHSFSSKSKCSQTVPVLSWKQKNRPMFAPNPVVSF